MFWSPITGALNWGDQQPGEVEIPERPSPLHLWQGGVWILGPTPVPASVTPLQARRAMRQAGVLDSVKAAVATDPDMQDAFDYATLFNRDSWVIGKAQALLHWTDAQIDDLFRLANTFAD